MHKDKIQNPEKNEEKTNSQNPNQKPEKNPDTEKDSEIQRIGISNKANEAVKECMERVNDGFVGGRVNRSQIANWILERAADQLTDSDIREVRAEHFDEVAALEGLLKQARDKRAMPADLRALLQRQMNGDDGAKRSGKKVLPKNSINDAIDGGGA